MASSNCPAHECLLQYASGKLHLAELEEVAAHVETCANCETTLARLSVEDDSLIAQLRRQPQEPSFVEEPECKKAMALAGAVAFARDDAENFATEDTAELGELGRLGEYQLLAKLGQGGMGAVYKARHAKLKRIVALKVLPREKVQEEHAVARFEREMEAVGQLDHPHIVRAHDAREIDGTHVLVMEYVEGDDLAAVVKRHGPLRVADACEVIRQAALGLQYAHEHGLVHRDIKPSNLMLTRQGQVKILDLGLALLNAGEAVPAGADELTGAGQAMGTADYMAPEQVTDSHSVDIRADIYSLGCTFYKLLTGHAPFGGPGYKTPISKMLAHVHDAAPPVQTVRSDVPAELAAVLDRMLAKSPEGRYSLPVEVVAAIERFADGANLAALVSGAALEPNPFVDKEGSTGAPRRSATSDTQPFQAAQSIPKPEATRRRVGLVAAVALGLAVFGAATWGALVILVRNKEGNVVASVSVPEGGSVEISDGKGKPPQRKPVDAVVAPSAKNVEPLPWRPAIARLGDPLSAFCLVSRPALFPEVLSWTLATQTSSAATMAVAVRPDGECVATGGEDGIVRMRRFGNGEVMTMLVGHDHPIVEVAWSPGGENLLSRDAGGVLRWWDVAANRELRILENRQHKAVAMAWSPDGRLLAAACSGGLIALWDGHSGDWVRGFSQPAEQLAWSPDGTKLASCGSPGDRGGESSNVSVRNVESGQILWSTTARTPDDRCLAWSPDGGQLAIATTDRGVLLCSATTGETLQVVKDATGCRPVWSPAGDSLGTMAERTLLITDVATGETSHRHAFSGERPLGGVGIDVAASESGWAVVAGKQLHLARGWPPALWQSIAVEHEWPQFVADRGARSDKPSGKEALLVTAEGHYRARPDVEAGLVYIVTTAEGQAMLSPSQFAEKYRWTNRAERAEDLATRHAEAMSQMALVGYPSAITGIGQWTIETRGHRGPTRAVGFRGDGKVVATGNDDGMIRLWDAAGGELLRILVGHDDRVRCLSWSPFGPHLATAGDDCVVRLWDTASGRILNELAGHAAPVTAIAWSADGRWMASGDENGRLVLWDPIAGRPTRVLEAHEKPVLALSWLADSKVVVSCSPDRALKLWDAGTGELRRLIQAEDGYSWRMAVSPDGRRLASLRMKPQNKEFVDYTLCVQDLEGQEPVIEGPVNGSCRTERICSLEWSRDCKHLLLTGTFYNAGYSRHVWSFPEGRLAYQYHKRRGYDFTDLAATFSADGRHAVFATQAGAVQIHDAISPKDAVLLPSYLGNTRSLAIGLDGSFLATGYEKGGLVLGWDTASGETLWNAVVGSDSRQDIWNIALSGDGQVLANNTVYSLETKSLRTLDRVHASLPGCWSPDDRLLGIAQSGIFDAATGKTLVDFAALPIASWHWEALPAFSPDSRLFAVKDSDHDHIQIREATSDKLLTTIHFGVTFAPASFAWSPDQKKLAAGLVEGEISVWDIASQKVLSRWHESKAAVRHLVWLDDHRLLSASKRGVWLHDLDTGAVQALNAAPVDAMSADGRLIAEKGPSSVRVRKLRDGDSWRDLLAFNDGKWAVVSSDGHWRAHPEASSEIRYVVATDQGQETLMPDEFQERYGWKNDPERTRNAK